MSDLPTYTVDRGRTRTFTVTVFKTSPLGPSGITGWLFSMTAKNKRSDLDAAAVLRRNNSQFTVVNLGNVTTDAVLTFTLNPADTENIADYTTLQADVSAQDTSGNKVTIIKFILIIDTDSTRVVS